MAVSFVGLLLLLLATSSSAGGACVVAKKLGNSLAVKVVTGEEETALSAVEKAEQYLLENGYNERYVGVHPQANTELPHAYVVVIKSVYTTIRGKQRTSYGCGFDHRSFEAAQHAALYNLQSYTWGWIEDYGYEVVEKFTY
jgi:hypothetical protein